MNCPNCQNALEENASFCSNCGFNLAAQPDIAQAQAAQDSNPQYNAPQYTQPQQPQYSQPQQPQYAQPQQPQYTQPQQPQYGQPQYAQPQYGQPQYGQPQYGQPQYGQPQYGQPQYGGFPGMVNPEINEFAKKANTLKIFGILAAVLMFGIGIVFSIIIWVTKLPDPVSAPSNPGEAQLLEKARKDRDLGKKLAVLPLIGLVLSFAIGFIGGIAAYM